MYVVVPRRRRWRRHWPSSPRFLRPHQPRRRVLGTLCANSRRSRRRRRYPRLPAWTLTRRPLLSATCNRFVTPTTQYIPEKCSHQAEKGYECKPRMAGSGMMTWQQDVFETGDGALASMAGGSFRTSNRPTLNLPLLLRVSVSMRSHPAGKPCSISVRVIAKNGPRVTR